MNKAMEEQKEAARLALAQGLCGLLVGLLWVSILAAVAVPSFQNVLMSHRMADDFGRLGRLAGFFDLSRGAFVLAAFAAMLSSWVMTARRVNPDLPPFPFDEARRPLLTWLLVFASGASFWVGLFLLGSPDLVPSGEPVLARLVAAAAGGAVCWLIISPAGLAGALGVCPPPGPACERPSCRYAAAAWGACFGLLAGVFLRGAERGVGFLFQWILEVGSPSFEMNAAQALVVYSLPVAAGALSFAVVFGSAPAWAADGSGAFVRLRRALIPAALLAVSVLWVRGLHRQAVAEFHWRAGSLVEAAALPDKTPPLWTLVVLGADGKDAPTAAPWPLEAKPWHGSGGAVAATEANAAKLTEFLAGPGRRSRYHRAAADVLARFPNALWDREAALYARELVTGVFGEDILSPAMESHWLSRQAPVTPANRARLEAVSDPGRYRIRGRAALTVAKAWWRFGDPRRARRWLDAARLTYRGDKDEPVALPEGKPFTDGAVQGRVTIGGKAAAGARVGLFRLPDRARALTPPWPGAPLSQLSDSRALGADGAFRFDHLSDGQYGVCLLAPPGTLPVKGRLKGGKLPGVFPLSSRAPRADLGLIALAPAP
ncbi:MAG: hypothetical protein HY927_11515 [Elusimicrobia bacterium]|nr:hypothetical protein [Elusimicrobiota bacterium]